jgi:beta-glucanase (GH16 family)
MMNTRGLTKGWQYGYFEARLRIPKAQGTTPAFWLLPDHDSKWPPEIDVFEIFQTRAAGDQPAFSSSVHWRDERDGRKHSETVSLAFPDPFGWHVVGLEWTPQWLITYVDGKEVVRRPNRFHEPMYAVFNVAVGGLTEPPDSEVNFPARMELDYFRVWQ